MFFKILRIQLDLYKYNLSSLLNINKDIIESCSIELYMKKQVISFEDYNKQLELNKITKKLNSINSELIKIEKEIKFL